MIGKAITTSAMLIELSLGSAAHAQPSAPAKLSMIGAWSGETPGQGGMTHGSDQYLADGSYVSAMQLPNGSIERIWGSYDAEQIATRQMRVHLQIHGFLPREICAQAPGFPMRCNANHVPDTLDVIANFSSPSSFTVNGVSMIRSAPTALLRTPVPERLVLAARAPVRPYIRQPVMPTLHPYVTPAGPGSVSGMHADDQQQQYRICGVNNGTVVHNNDSTVTCVN